MSWFYQLFIRSILTIIYHTPSEQFFQNEEEDRSRTILSKMREELFFKDEGRGSLEN